MTTIYKIIIGLCIFTIPVICSVVWTRDAVAYAANDACAKVEMVFARGSGQEFNKAEATRFFDRIQHRLKDVSLTPHTYELGAESYGGHIYPAVDIGFFNGNAAGAILSSGYANDYGNSVKDGLHELHSYLKERYTKCQSMNPYFILGGYSQGAQVIGQAMVGISDEIRDRIVFVGLFGDPKLYFPEGEGGTLFRAPPACRGEGFSIYRRTFNDCRLVQGRLSARKPYLSDNMATKTGLWCLKSDYVCGTSNYPYSDGHSKYATAGGSIDAAAQEAATRLKLAIESETPPAPTPGQPPAPSLASKIDIEHRFGDGISGQDVIILVDRSYEMSPNFTDIIQKLHKTLPELEAAGSRFALFSYYSAPHPVTGALTTGFYGLPLGYQDATSAINTFVSFIGMDDGSRALFHRGSVLDAVNGVMKNITNWQDGARKSLIVLTDSPELNGDTASSATLA